MASELWVLLESVYMPGLQLQQPQDGQPWLPRGSRFQSLASRNETCILQFVRHAQQSRHLSKGFGPKHCSNSMLS